MTRLSTGRGNVELEPARRLRQRLAEATRGKKRREVDVRTWRGDLRAGIVRDWHGEKRLALV
jgi:hypothetical protein